MYTLGQAGPAVGWTKRRNSCISDTSSSARFSPPAVATGTDVFHHAFGWYSPRALDNGDDHVELEDHVEFDTSPSRLRSNSLPASFNKGFLSRRDPLQAASMAMSPPVLRRNLESTASSTIHPIISSSDSISPTVIHGDIHGRLAAAARVKSYLLKEEKASYARLPCGERLSTPEWFKQAGGGSYRGSKRANSLSHEAHGM